METVIGMDVINGGIAWLKGDKVKVLRMPTAKSESGKTSIDGYTVYVILKPLVVPRENRIAIEAVHSMPMRGVASTFSLVALWAYWKAFATVWESSLFWSVRKNGKPHIRHYKA